ncbi:histidine kinase [Bacteroidota bacterium]
MRKRILIHNLIFRIVVPPIYGVIMYVLILLIFDSLSSLSKNFFNFEALLIILLTYLLFAGLRHTSIILDKKCPSQPNLKLRTSLQFSMGLAYSILLISIVISLYFKYLIGFTSYSTELIAFNIIFGISAVFYNILYFSLTLLTVKNEEKLNKENILKENLEIELMAFKRDINPEFFYGGLETIISLMKYEVKEADAYIQNFSLVYRYILDNRKRELISLRSELQYVTNYLSIINIRYNNNIIVKNNIANNYLMHNIIPCSLQRIIENIVISNVISNLHPLDIDLSIENEILIVKSNRNKKLNIPESVHLNFKSIQKAYSYFTNSNIEKVDVEEDYEFVKIPLLKLDKIEELE